MNYAFVTILSTNNYYKGVIALFESIKNTNTKYNKYVVVVNEDIRENIINEFINKGYKVIKRPKITFDNINNETYKYWHNTFDKFHVFDLDEFDKIVYLDSDMYVSRNIDELFDLPHMSAVIAGKTKVPTWEEIGSGLMVIVPKKGISNELINTLKNTKYSKDIGDQDVIETYFDWKNQNLAISENYNLFADNIDYYINEHGYKKDEIAVVHFIGSIKPWMLNKKEIINQRIDYLRENKLYQLEFFNKYIELLSNIGKKLSIITPYYNTLEYTKELASILEPQLTNEVEWIIIDDGCHEKELDILNAKVIHLENNSGNASRPRNIGLDIANGDFIVFIDSDDKITNNYIDKIINKIDTEKFDYCYFGWKTREHEYIIKEEPLEWNHCVWDCIYSRELIGNERFNEDYNLNEDGDFNNRVRKGKRTNILDILYLYSWQEREDSISGLYSSGKIKFNRKD